MRPRYLLAVLPVFLAACLPAHAERGYRSHGPVVDRGPSIGELKRACEFGNRRACIGLGREIEQRQARSDGPRDRWRDRWRSDRYRQERWHHW